MFLSIPPERLASIILLNVAYNPPGPPFDLEALLEMTEKQLGRSLFAYWQPFTALDGLEILPAHVERVWTALHIADDEWMKVVCAFERP